MWALVISLINWNTLQASRKTVKLCLSALMAETLALVFINAFVLMFLQKQMSPFVSAFGLFWIFLTAAAIWVKGDVEVDSLFLARVFNLEIGKEFTRALSIFFLIQSSIVIFFFFVPFWKFWAGFLLLPLLIAGVLLSGSLTEKKVNWRNFYRIYWILTVLAISAMFLFSVIKIKSIKSFFNSLSLSSFSSLSQNMAIMGAVALIFLAVTLCFIIKNKGVKAALIWLTVLSFIGLTIWGNIGHRPKGASACVQTMPSAQWSKVTYFDLNPEETIDTGIPYGPGDVITFYQPNDPPATFYVVGTKTTMEIKKRVQTGHACGQGGDVWLKGGLQPVRVGVSVHRR